ncbi:putative reverse transcriptase domain-containing protein [Tanacetum coccineum]
MSASMEACIAEHAATPTQPLPPGTTLEADLRRDSVMETGYAITDTWDKIVEAMLEVAPTTLEGVNQRVIELATTIRQENKEPYHHHTAMILDREEMYAHIVWTSFEERSAAIEAHVRTLEKMAPSKRTTRASPATTTTLTSILVTDAQLRTLIERGVAAVLAERDANISKNGDDNHNSGTGGRRQAAVRHDVAYAMPRKTLKKMMTDKYCPRGKIKKLETEMWNLKVKGTDVMSYNQHFQELVLMCDRMFPEESDVVEKYVGGLPDMIHGSVKASKPKTMQEAIEFATKLMDKKILTITECQADNKRKFEDTS